MSARKLGVVNRSAQTASSMPLVVGLSIGSFTRIGEGMYASDDGQHRLLLIDRDGAVNAGAAGDRRYSAHLIRATDGKRLAETQGVHLCLRDQGMPTRERRVA
jgi:hypothetical protein